ncbi:NAD(P)-dependent alcohol dehydrogenase [Clostridium felsineum]|uniref:NADP-dependent isopropanol dehydrogenase n=1 Tax=Clostridium felsineum TaxID=36839 RepID=A0A1S8MI43_9CLOT|nr:NAD(P)-dependent alcohol dehydrogenase [Clostridium felsineum]URZ07090.1 NADP-dependent isopropanol dehydrogenase [Clostridium felsineum]URZ12120.1 NADP-dependent isopropanol dehydrogenase [Clostridium felsineum]
MKGFGMLSINKSGWIEKEKPVCGPLDAIVHPTVLAPCSSDTHVFHGGSGEKSNLILGHEAVGKVVEVGNMVNNFKIGDTVVIPCTTPNWLSQNVQGEYNAHDEGLMKSFKFLGSKDGTFAEYFHVNQADANLVLLPENVLPEAAVMTVDMMSTGFHGVENANVSFGDTVVVIGIGPVGLMAVAGSKLRGAGRIIAIGTRPNCVAVAKEYGATDIVSYKEGDIVEQVMSLTHGGADSVIIAGGNVGSFKQAIDMTKPGGYISNVNFFDVSDTLAMPAYSWGMGMANKTIRGGFCPGGALRITKMLNMVANNRVDTTKLITHRFSGFEKIEDAFEIMDKKPSDLIKPVVFID